ncbi:MAG: DUF2207 domain-containing protein [Clostridia bacterium]|nr:DUF2207 domain-containing protein [Clostridia bacterium]
MSSRKISILIIGVLFLIGMIIPIQAFADTQEEHCNITMDIKIDESGIASITENWDVELYAGSEMYKPYYNLQDSKIRNLTVTDETGTKYEYQTSWKANASQEEKAGKCGINNISNGQEICWGIGSYGKHVYTVSYEITNFVYIQDGKQVSYFRLIQPKTEPEPESIQITVSGPFEFTENNVTASGSGFTGTTSIVDGVVKVSTSSGLKSSQCVDLDLKFEDESFSNLSESDYLENKYNADDKEYNQGMTEKEKREAEENTQEKRNSFVKKVLIIVIIIILIIFITRGRNDYNNRNYYNY